jgi:hypothetical protein
MRWVVSFFLLFRVFAAEFDYAFIGTSPVPLFEALYKHHCGHRVLILEAASECGGAWKSIDICGVSHADMGCHEISSTPALNQFLTEYAGCKIVPCNNNYYFSRGCFELVDNLLKRIQAAKIPLFTDCKVDSVYLDPIQREAVLKTKKGMFTASKIVVTSGSSIQIEGNDFNPLGAHKFYHLYLLIQDPSPPRFSYHHGIGLGISRMMNLSSFVGLEHTGRQLIVLQTYSAQPFEQSEMILSALKSMNLVDPAASLIKAESYIYEQGPYFQIGRLPPHQQMFFEVLSMPHFNTIHSYASKWKEALPPFVEGQP